MKNYELLIGKYISADGWHRDNGGSMSGIISKVSDVSIRGTVNVFVLEKEHDFQMDCFSFTTDQLGVLLELGKLPKANGLLNSGTNAYIK